jgi:CDP-diacylglycerol--serine O-phosphatidyltransferase
MSSGGAASSRFAVFAPCVFTVIRIASGFFAVMATFHATTALGGKEPLGAAGFDYAAMAIVVALLSDLFDGKVARLLGSASEFGTQLDSLADVLAFGMAPAILGFYWGVLPSLQAMSARDAQIAGAAGFLACCTFVVCTVFRLARFNVSVPHPSGEKRFTGLPAPGAAAVVAAVVHFAERPLNGSKETALWLALILILAVLMVSRVGYNASGWVPARLQRPLWMLPAAILALWVLWTYPGATFLALALVFALSGPFAGVLSSLRRSGHTAED